MSELKGFYSVVIAMFLVLGTGFFARKKGIINDTASKNLSTVIVKLGQPMLIISSLASKEYSPDNLKNGGIVLLISFAIHLVFCVLAYLFAKPVKDLDERKVSEFSLIFSNCGFIGFPIIEALKGSDGLFLGAFYLVGMNIVLWSWGVFIYAKGRSDVKISPRKIIFNTGTVCGAIGFGIFMLKSVVPIPAFFEKFTTYLGEICTPISILIIGALIATKPLKSLVTNPKIYYVSAMRLIVIPLLICVLCKLCGLSNDLILLFTVMASMPTASVATVFSELYGVAPGFASQINGVTTLLSMGTMPLIILAERFIESL